ncbi:MAG: PXPV repeat protein [Ramlibacter sp.]
MKSTSATARIVAAAAVVLGCLAAASAAHARSDVHFSIGLNVPGVYVQPAPVYTRPAPVYVQPAPVYVQPAPVYYGGGRNGAWGDRDHDGVPNIHDRYDNRRHHGHRGHRGPGAHRDADRDGVPNRYDRAPGNPYYR